MADTAAEQATTSTEQEAQAQPTSTPSPAPPKATTAKAARPARKPRDTRTPRSTPYQEVTSTLNTFHALQSYERAHSIGDEGLFTASVILRAFAPEPDCVEVEKIIEDLITKCKTALDDERKRLETVAETYAVPLVQLSYSSPQEVKMKLTSPRAVDFASLFKELDSLVEIFDTLWFAKAIKTGEHSKGIYAAKRKVVRLAYDLRNLAIRSMAAAQRKDTDAHDPRAGTVLDKATPAVTQPTEEAAAAADEALEVEADSAPAPEPQAEAEPELEAQ